MIEESKEIEVLDHGFVRLVEHMGNDISVVRAARVSYNAAWRAGQDSGSDYRLIHYLWKNHHTSPFEAVEFQFEIKAPIFVLRQWHRHRTWSYNELSARYRELTDEFYLPSEEIVGVQSKDNKQVREMVKNDAAPWILSLMKESCEAQFQAYKALLNWGVPRELARSILPLSTYSHMFAKVDLRNLFLFFDRRLHTHAQYEIRVYAEAMLRLIEPIVPVCVDAWRENAEGKG